MKKRILALLFALTLSVRADFIPFLTVEAESFTKLYDESAAFGSTIGVPALSIGLIGIGDFLGSPGLLGIDRTRPIRAIFSLEGDALSPEPVFIVPLLDADGASYLKSLQAIANKTDSSANLTTWTRKNNGKALRFRVASGFAVFAEESSASDEFLSRVASMLEKNPNAFRVRGLPDATLRMQVLTKPLLPKLETLCRNTIEDSSLGENRAQALELTTTAIEILRSVSTVSLGMTYSDAMGFSLYLRTSFLPDSPFLPFLQNKSNLLQEALPTIGGSPEFVFADCIQGDLMKIGLPMFDGAMALLEEIISDEPEGQQAIALFKQCKEVFRAYPSFVAGSLRYTKEGYPFLQQVYRCEDAPAYCKTLLDILQKSNEITPQYDVSTRTAQGTTIYSYALAPSFTAQNIPANEPPIKFMIDKNYCQEFAVRDNLMFVTAGPKGTIESLFGEQPAYASCEPLDLFKDLLGNHTILSVSTMDFMSIMHGLFSFLANEKSEMFGEVPPEALALFAQDPGRFGQLVYTDSTNPDSMTSAIRLAPGLVRSIAGITQILIAENQNRANSEDSDDEDDSALSDEELESLLQEIE